MSRAELDAHLSGSVIGKYEKTVGYLQALGFGTHPCHIAVTLQPDLPSALVHFRTKELSVVGSNERALDALYRTINRLVRRARGSLAVEVFRSESYGIAAVIHGSRQDRTKLLQGLLQEFRKKFNQPSAKADTLRIGVSTPLEAAAAVGQLLTYSRLRGRTLSVGALRPMVLRMLHEVSLRRMETEFFKGLLFRLGKKAMTKHWRTWEQVRPCYETSALPNRLPEMIDLSVLRELHQGTMRERVRKLTALHDLLIASRLHRLAKDVNRPKGEGTAPTTPQRYEFYALWLLAKDELILGRADESRRRECAFAFMDEVFCLPEEVLPEPPLPNKNVDFGPVGYKIIPTDEDPEDHS